MAPPALSGKAPGGVNGRAGPWPWASRPPSGAAAFCLCDDPARSVDGVPPGFVTCAPMMSVLGARLVEVVKAVAPLVLVVCLLQVALVHAPLELFLRFLVGSGLAAAGMLLLFLGIDLGILPMGRFIGAELPKRGSILLIVGVAFAIGFATTVAEPDVLVLAGQVDQASRGRLPGQLVVYVVAIGVAAMTAVAIARVVFGWPMRLLVSAAYLVVLVLALVAPADFVPLAFDAGSVTTGLLTAPVVIAVTLGLSSVLSGRSAVSDGFGILGLASVGSIISVMLMGLLWP